MDVAQEAQITNRDTLDCRQEGAQIKDVRNQSAKAPRQRGFLFSAFGQSMIKYTPAVHGIALLSIGVD